MLQVVLKSTLSCNGDCVYCSADSTLDGPPTLPAERFPELFGRLARWLRADPDRRLGILWHGGEPLLPGLDYLRTAWREEQRAFGEDLPRVSNQIQSNLTLLTEAWVPFLKQFLQGGIGTSFDVVDGIRGLRSGEPLAPRWTHAVEVCRRAGLRLGVVYVVHRRSLPLARTIYRYLRNALGRASIRFNPLYREGRGAEGGVGDLAVEPLEYGRFLVEVADEWWPDRARASVLPLTEWVQAWRGSLDRLCCDSGGRCQETHLGVGPDGSAYGCGRASDALDPDLRLGNVFEDELEALLDHPLRRRMSERGARLLEGACRDCRWWPLCHGGCPMDARIYHRDPMRETWFCDGRRHVFEDLERRLGPPPASVGTHGGHAPEDLT